MESNAEMSFWDHLEELEMDAVQSTDRLGIFHDT